MITQTVKDYIALHRLCPDNLFADWECFADLLYAQGGCVSYILWFEHVAIAGQTASLGHGGYVDPQNDKYMYAETDIQRREMETLTLPQVKQYIRATIAAYPGHRLLPAFFGIV